MALTMYHYIYEQQQALQHILQIRKTCTAGFVSRFQNDPPDRIYLIGSGTSLNGALAAAPFMEQVLQIEVTAHAPSMLPVIRGNRPLILLISQGGNSTNMLAAIDELKGRSFLALTGSSDCRINEVCSEHILLACGPEEAGPKTKGYASTILTLYLMALEAALAAGLLSGEQYDAYIAGLESAVSAIDSNLRSAEAWVRANMKAISGTPQFVLVGKHQAGIVAREGALKLVETVLTPALAYEFEEFLHGPIGLINDKLGGIYFLPPRDDPDRGRMLALADYHQKQGACVCIVAPDADVQLPSALALEETGPWHTLPFVQILVCQLIGAILPEAMGLPDRGMQIFSQIDRLVNIKYGGRA